MAVLRKGFCTHCNGDEKLRIFNVNKEAEVCYCPYCMKEMKPKQAIANYSYLISSYLKKASKYLFESTEYLLAYQTFAHIIDLDETIKVARFGRVLALVYISTLRTSKINFAFMIHRQEAPKLYHYQETANEYYYFLSLLLTALDEYENKMKQRLTSHNIFYDMDCVLLYLKRIEEIRSYKDFIGSEADFFVESNKEHFNKIVNRVKNAENAYEQVFKDTYVTADGYSYNFIGFNKDGTPLITLQSTTKAQKNRHVEPTSLFPKDNKKSKIRDDVYLNNLTLARLVAASVPFAIVLFVIAAAGVIASFFIPSQIAKILIYIGSASLLIVSFVLIILHFSWKNRLKKKYYNGTNPFIFK